jgi:DNA/RNA-binding domain of Phe-tRNA-synthetase-like protein
LLFAIDGEIFDLFPELQIGVLQVDGLDNSGSGREIDPLIREAEKDVRQSFSQDMLSQEPRIQAWRRAYSAFGAKPKKYKSSVESLLRTILKGGGLRPINPIVDIYNYVSVRKIIPIGGDDLDKIDGSLRLCLAQGGETFLPLNGRELEEAKPGEVIYRDEKEVLCRRWNWREADKTKMTAETHRILLVAEALPPVAADELEGIIKELERHVINCCGGRSKTAILDRRAPSFK